MRRKIVFFPRLALHLFCVLCYVQDGVALSCSDVCSYTSCSSTNFIRIERGFFDCCWTGGCKNCCEPSSPSVYCTFTNYASYAQQTEYVPVGTYNGKDFYVPRSRVSESNYNNYAADSDCPNGYTLILYYSSSSEWKLSYGTVGATNGYSAMEIRCLTQNSPLTRTISQVLLSTHSSSVNWSYSGECRSSSGAWTYSTPPPPSSSSPPSANPPPPSSNPRSPLGPITYPSTPVRVQVPANTTRKASKAVTAGLAIGLSAVVGVCSWCVRAFCRRRKNAVDVRSPQVSLNEPTQMASLHREHHINHV